ncbi:hypothetical protein B4N89_04845 [Embleya scabrispora]|uniref:Uncharacterized protein n=1 Tax=Embleya scabrispora TaxID=159449 RepID=A0A1T3NUF0_9ACTN|nr:hypothetical protein B4N89_04845 [Embleya scabrispora]
MLSRRTNPSILRQDAPGVVITTGVPVNPVSAYTKGAAGAGVAVRTLGCRRSRGRPRTPRRSPGLWRLRTPPWHKLRS